jgi:hypothetical protein
MNVRQFLNWFNLVVKQLTFLENISIWNLNHPSIPDIFLLDEDHIFERAADLEINLEQQINLQGLIFPLTIGMIIAFSINQKDVQIGKTIFFDNISVTVHIYKPFIKAKLITWSLTEPEQMLTVERKLIIKTNLLFTKKGNLKKKCIKGMAIYNFM